MKALGTLLFAALGLGLAGFAASIAFGGAEPRVPRGSAAIEGELVDGPTTASPVGQPFLYGEVRIQDADNTQTNVGTIHWRGAFGDRHVRVRTASGERAIELPGPSRWHVAAGVEASREVASLGGLPIVGRVTVGDRLSPPFRLTVRAVRPGDHVIVATDPGSRVPLYVGPRAEHEETRERRERGRFPMVALLGVMALVSLYVARRVASGTLFESTEGG